MLGGLAGFQGPGAKAKAREEHPQCRFTMVRDLLVQAGFLTHKKEGQGRGRTQRLTPGHQGAARRLAGSGVRRTWPPVRAELLPGAMHHLEMTARYSWEPEGSMVVARHP
jgi:hypothetical protein